MSLNQVPPAEFLDTTTYRKAEIWNEILSLQTELFFPLEYNYLKQHNPWEQACSVLDVGCGNGQYLSKLIEAFPDKTYAGIDLSHELVAIGLQNGLGPQIDLEVADYHDYQPDRKFDMLLMRFVVQHMDRFSRILSKAETLLSPHGRLLIIEPLTAESENFPETPLFASLLQQYEVYCEKAEKNRTQILNISELISKEPHWQCSARDTVLVRTIDTNRDAKLMKLYRLWVKIIEVSNLVNFDFESVYWELDEWSELPTSYSEIAIQFAEGKFTS